MAFATVTLQYDCGIGLQQSAKMLAKVAAVSLYQGELDLLGMVVNSDVTAVAGSNIRRTIVLGIQPRGNAQFPSADLLIAATKGLYKSVLNLALPSSVVEATPVVA